MRGLQQDGFLPLTAGAYAARGLIADAQKCINLYPEINPEETDPPAAVTHYPRQGLRALGNGPGLGRVGIGRGLYTALGNGNLYAVVGANVFYIDPGWGFNLLGQITNGTAPVSITDNGTTAVIVDGSANGWQINLANNAFSPIVDATGTFIGGVRADYVDTFLTFNAPGSTEWYCSNALQVTFNALQTANATSTPDPLLTHAVLLRQVWLIKQFYSEVWYLSGAVPFPFQEWPNVHVPYGIASPYSLVKADSNLFWISRNKDGQVMAVMTEGYAVKAISTRALEDRWKGYARIDDALGYTFQRGGHTFVVWHFPTADEAWGYDLSTKQWHQRAALDNNGLFHRERVAFHALVSRKNGYPDTNVGLDWSTGQIYAIDENTFTDNGLPIACLRSFPHVTDGLKQITVPSFVLDVETGEAPNTAELDQTVSPWSNGWSNGFGPLIVQKSPVIAARLSRDGGATFGNYRPKKMMSAGHYRSMMRWRGWGQGRDLVYEVAAAIPGKWALQGAYIDPLRHEA